MAPVTELSRKTFWLINFTAVTFAQSGLHDDAISILEPARRDNRGFNSVIAENLVLKGVQLMYGTVSIKPYCSTFLIKLKGEVLLKAINGKRRHDELDSPSCS